MPDTGAPYFIPFADPTDLVRDWPALSEDVAEAVADGLDEAGNAGIGPNVQSALLTSTFSTTSTSPVNITGLSVTITPSSDTAKILVIVNLAVGITSNLAAAYGVGGVSRGTTNLAEFVSGNAAGDNGRQASSGSIIVLDEPATDDPVTYNATLRGNAASATVNTSRDPGGFSTWASSITVVEVAA